MNESKEPHPWEEFLKVRMKCMKWMIDEMGYNYDTIAKNLSMDPIQVQLIIKGNPHIFD